MSAAEHTPEEDAKAAELRRQHFTWDYIARVLGRPSGAAVRLRQEKLARQRAKAAEAHKQARIRPCLRCGGRFQSSHFGHRFCNSCTPKDDAPFDALYEDETYLVGHRHAAIVEEHGHIGR